MTKEELLHRLMVAISEGDIDITSEVTRSILEAGIDPLEAIQQGATKGLDILGERFRRLDAYLPDLVRGGQAMKACQEILMPHISKDEANGIMLGKVVIGTVSSDIHDIGKSMVANMLSMGGFEVHDLGVDVPAKKFIEKAEEFGANVIALSALLTTSAYYQGEIIRYLEDIGLREKYYVVVGGAPVSAEWAVEIGADGYGKTAVDATQLLKKMLTEGASPPLRQPLVVQ